MSSSASGQCIWMTGNHTESSHLTNRNAAQNENPAHMRAPSENRANYKLINCFRYWTVYAEIVTAGFCTDRCMSIRLQKMEFFRRMHITCCACWQIRANLCQYFCKFRGLNFKCKVGPIHTLIRDCSFFNMASTEPSVARDNLSIPCA